MSLDHAMALSPSEFRPLHTPGPQEYQSMDTNTGPQEIQHFMQEAQQHQPAQPGFPVPNNNFQHHLQQQLNPMHFQGVLPPQQALKELNDHINAFQETYGSFIPPNATSTTPTMTISQPNMAEMPTTPTLQSTLMTELNSLPSHRLSPQPMQGLPHTPTSRNHTAPSTPQNHYWPSPPTTAKHARSQSYQYDVAPMPTSFENVPIVKVNSSPYPQQDALFGQDSFAGGSDHGYASSYASSVADCMSPGRSVQHTPHMPTLFEEPTTPFDQHGSLTQEDILLQNLQASEGASDSYLDQRAIDEQEELQMRLKFECDATIEYTGVSLEQVESFMSEQDQKTSKWTCLYEEEPGRPCMKLFGRKENIKSHIQTHLGDRQYKCNVCKKCFVRQHDLKRHSKIHSGDKPHKCACGQGFARHDALTRHRQRACCVGALPGFERKEVKRGRPKKNRPNREERTDKATRARRIDAALDDGQHYASSSSAMSDRSYPVTPPDTSDSYDANAFIDLTGMDAHTYTSSSSWHDTPPTSPVTHSSPTKTIENSETQTTSFDFGATSDDHTVGYSPSVFSHHSSPPNASSPPAVVAADSPPGGNTDTFGQSVFDFGAINAHQTFTQQTTFSSPGDSSDNSTDCQDWDARLDDEFDMALAGTLNGSTNVDPFSAPFDQDDDIFSQTINAWIAGN